jgi:hypothetical protein
MALVFITKTGISSILHKKVRNFKSLNLINFEKDQ